MVLTSEVYLNELVAKFWIHFRLVYHRGFLAKFLVHWQEGSLPLPCTTAYCSD